MFYLFGNTAPPASILEMMFGGSLLGVLVVGLILLLSLISIYLIIELSLTVRKKRLLPEEPMAELESLIAEARINDAVDVCYRPENDSLACRVILAGLIRYRSSEFGYAEYRVAVEEAGENQTGQLYRRTEPLQLIAAVAPMLGLTGTVIGMIEAFTTVAAEQGLTEPQNLAGGIGQALVTTLLGLLVAMPSMVAYSYFRNRIDALVADAGDQVERVLLPLGSKKLR